jgi:hypothetical protein
MAAFAMPRKTGNWQAYALVVPNRFCVHALLTKLRHPTQPDRFKAMLFEQLTLKQTEMK